MQTEKLTWQHDGISIELAADWSGQGPLVLLLPALSSISTRRKMGPLQELLDANYQAVAHARAMTGGLKSIRTS